MRKSKQTSFDRSLYSSSDEIIRFHSTVCGMFERLYSDSTEPSPFHKVMDELARSRPHFQHYTQNIDCIEHLLPDLEAKTVRLHGQVDQARCRKCNWVCDFEPHLFLFKGGVSVPFYKAKDLNGPWEDVGTVLSGPSIIPKENRTRPWAPSVIQKDNVFYCFYTISQRGSNDSAIGIATSKELKSGVWKDHGAIIQTGTGPGSQKFPFKESNALDPDVFIDPKDGKAYLNYGSFFSGLWQVPLSDDLLSLENPENVNARHLATTKSEKRNDEEGSFMSYKDGYYYLWFSRGKCCNFTDPNNLPENGEYVD
jgi:hypothetical protein